MRIPLSWLQEYIGTEVSVETIEQSLINIGIEVDIEVIYPRFKGVIVSRIEEVKSHPSAPALKIARVYDGKAYFDVVTAAQYCVPGMLVAFAPLGAEIEPLDGKNKEKVTIQEADFKGVLSSGMLCSEAELGLGDEADNLLEFSSEEFPIGFQLEQIAQESVLDISLTPNLGHCLSVYGVARELAAALNRPLIKQWTASLSSSLQSIKERVSSAGNGDKEQWEIDLFADEGCSQYGLLSISGLSLTSRSPFAWRRRLFHCGMRSVNPIVDALNLSTIEMGQPMHGFDKKAFKGINRVVVKKELETAHEIRSIELLDGGKCILPKGSIIIENSDKEPLAIAGIMGGIHSGVTQETTDVVIESAYFDMKAIRRSSKSLGIISEASKRFERGVDPQGVAHGLICFLGYIKPLFPQMKIRCVGYEKKGSIPLYKQVNVRLSRAESLLGISISQADVEAVFSRLQYEFQWISADLLEVSIPAYRHDIEEEVDLIEDIAKLIGYALLETGAAPKYRSGTLSSNPLYDFELKARRAFVSVGLQECVTCSLISPSRVELVLDNPVPKAAIVSVQNPMSIEQSVLRPSLLPGLIDVLLRNIAQRQTSLSVFEIGTIFLRSDGKIKERLSAGILLSGSSVAAHFSRAEKDADFFDLKAVWDSLRALLHIEGDLLQRSHISLFHPGRQAGIIIAGHQIGVIGEIHPKVVQGLGLTDSIYFMEIDLQDLMEHCIDENMRAVKPLQLYPAMERDWTVTLSKKISYSELEDAIKRSASPLLEQVDLIALFSNEKLGVDVHNVTVRMKFRNSMRTLEQSEVDRAFQEITESALRQIG